MNDNIVKANINGKMYTLVSDEGEKHLESLIEILNKQIASVKGRNSSLYGERPLVLAALNVCDMYLKAEEGGKLLIENMQRKYSELVEENKKLNEIINQSDYELDLVSLRSQLEIAKKEIADLKRNQSKYTEGK